MCNIENYSGLNKKLIHHHKFKCKCIQGSLKVAATSMKLEIRLYAHLVGMNKRSGTKAIFTLIGLAHAFGTRP